MVSAPKRRQLDRRLRSQGMEVCLFQNGFQRSVSYVNHLLPFGPLTVLQVDPKLMIPANAVILSTACTILLSMINIGSESAFNAILSLQNVAQMATYGISLSCVFYRRLTAPHLLPEARWSLGRWGIWINGVGILYSWQICFWCFWPNRTPVSVESFNWAPVVFLVILVASLITYYFKGHKTYVAPAAKIEVRREDRLIC